MAEINKITRLTVEQYKTLVNEGSVLKDGNTITHDSKTLYVVDAPCSPSGYYSHTVVIGGTYTRGSTDISATLTFTFYSSICLPILSLWDLVKIPIAKETIGYLSAPLDTTAPFSLVKIDSLTFNSSTISYDFKIFITSTSDANESINFVADSFSDTVSFI